MNELSYLERKAEQTVRIKPVQDGDPLLTVREVGRTLRVDETTVRRWIKAGILDAVVLPHVGTRCAYRIRKSLIDALLSDGRTAR